MEVHVFVELWRKRMWVIVRMVAIVVVFVLVVVIIYTVCGSVCPPGC